MRFEGKCKTLCEPEDGRNVGHIADNINAHPTLCTPKRVLLDQVADVCCEELVDVLFEPFLEKYLVQNLGPFVMFLLFVPPNHEVMSCCAIANSSLVHDDEALAVIENCFAAFLRLDADDLVVAGRTLDIVLVEDAVAFDDALSCLGRVEG